MPPTFASQSDYFHDLYHQTPSQGNLIVASRLAFHKSNQVDHLTNNDAN